MGSWRVGLPSSGGVCRQEKAVKGRATTIGPGSASISAGPKRGGSSGCSLGAVPPTPPRSPTTSSSHQSQGAWRRRYRRQAAGGGGKEPVNRASWSLGALTKKVAENKGGSRTSPG